MSKKKFSDGLDGLFSEQPVLLEESGAGSLGEMPVRERRAAHKNFMNDLDALFQEALDERFGGEAVLDLPAESTPGIKSKSTPAFRAAGSGLDALIRQTIDVREWSADEETGKKRLTVAVDRSKLEKLKTIARLENAYLKDILLQLIDEYIQDYSQQKGLD